MTGWDRLVEEKIQKAIEEGVFDDLPGKGRPLNLDEAPFEEPDMRLAHHLLRSSGYTLPWIAERKEIENDIRGARSGLLRSWRRHGAAVPNEWTQGEWQRAVNAFRRQVEAINARIRDYNLVVPVSAAQRQLLDPEREVGTITTGTDI
jgi:DnaJ family protein C protein 28